MTEPDLGIPGLADFVQIGSGGFATVYSAFELDASRRVAVKVLAAMDERGQRRFERERHTMGQTTGHDSIVTMFRSGYTEPDARPFLVMEHMSGGSLQDHLDQRGPLPVDQAVALVRRVVDGLGYAHGMNILHKDVKPANILISATGAPKLGDFGIAAIRDATSTSQMAFSLLYTPPETFTAVKGPGGETIDPRDERSDLYSLAASLYALVAGRPLFSADSQATLMSQILTEAPPPTGHRGLDEFLATALAKDPAHRFPNAAQFAAALDRVGQVAPSFQPPAPAPAGQGTGVPNPGPSDQVTLVGSGARPGGPPPVFAPGPGPAGSGQPPEAGARPLLPWLLGAGAVLAIVVLGVFVAGSLLRTTDDAPDAVDATETASGETDGSSTDGDADGSAALTEAADTDGDGGDVAVAAVISDECAIPDPAEPVAIDVIGWEFPSVTQYAAELEECEEGNYGFNVQFLDSVQAQDAMRLDAATGAPEFEIYQGSNSFITELANAGALLPLNDLIDTYGAEYGLDQIDPAFFEPVSVDGNIYAIPMVSNTMHLFYNEPVLTSLGVEVPTTFEEALAACATVQDNGYDAGFVYMLSAGWAWQIEFDSVLGSLGVSPIDPVTGQPNFNGPEGIQAATLLKQMWEECGGSVASSYSTDDIQAAFQTGEVVLGHTWASRAGAMDDAEASTEVGNIQFAPALSTGGPILAAPAYVDGYAIPVGASVDPETIFLAILAATDLESQEAAAEFGLVTRTGVSNPAGPRNGDAAEASLAQGRGPDLGHPAAPIARAKLGEALITILNGTPVDEALAAAEAAYLAEANAQNLIG